MSLSTLLDSAPQVPSDYANHFIFGGLLGAVVFGLAYQFMPLQLAWIAATGAVFLLCGVKKIEDYFVQHETVGMCVGKTIVTAALPACFYLGTFLRG